MKKRLNLLCAIVLLVLGWSVVVTGYYMVVGAAEGVRGGTTPRLNMKPANRAAP